MCWLITRVSVPNDSDEQLGSNSQLATRWYTSYCVEDERYCGGASPTGPLERGSILCAISSIIWFTSNVGTEVDGGLTEVGENVVIDG